MNNSKYKSGSGWHNQSVRHSLARRYGHAGGHYADDLRKISAIKEDRQMNDKQMWAYIGQKSVLELSDNDKVREFARNYTQKLYDTERNTYTDAYDIVSKLGMGGLWRGNDIAIMLVAKKLKQHSMFKRNSSSKKKSEPEFEIVRPLNATENREVIEEYLQGGVNEIVHDVYDEKGNPHDALKEDIPEKLWEAEPHESVIFELDGKIYSFDQDYSGMWDEGYLIRKIGEKPKGKKHYYVEWSPVEGAGYMIDASRKYASKEQAQKEADRLEKSIKKTSDINVSRGGILIITKARVKEIIE